MEKEKQETPQDEKDFVNPIDKDTIADSPHILPYASNVGSAIIKPIDKGRVKGLAMNAMYEQTDVQLDQIREQVELLIEQARVIHSRVDVSEKIYMADMGFEPRIGHTYHLYERKSGKHVLSLVAPEEWGNNPPFEYVSTVKLLSDHTWEVLDRR
ncbi:MAG: DUF2452 domain-containing protein [Bacteroidota bacterium]